MAPLQLGQTNMLGRLAFVLMTAQAFLTLWGPGKVVSLSQAFNPEPQA